MPLHPVLGNFATGTAFGAALAAAAVHRPDVIVAQMKLENWSMVEMFLTASGTSAILVHLSQQHAGLLPPTLKPRGFSSHHLGLGLGVVDGNVVGGLLQGFGMALAGACAGTVFAQAGAGFPSGAWTLVGSGLGGVLWSGVVRPAVEANKEKRKRKAAADAAAQKSVAEGGNNDDKKGSGAKLAIYEYLPIGRLGSLLLLEAVFAAAVAVVVAASSSYSSSSSSSSSASSHSSSSSLLSTLLSSIASLLPAGWTWRRPSSSSSSSSGGAGEAATMIISPVAGGLLVAAAQVVSIVTRANLIGTSTAFEEAGDWCVWSCVGAEKSPDDDDDDDKEESGKEKEKKKKKKRPSYNAMMLALGVMAGSQAVTRLLSSSSSSEGVPTATAMMISPARAVAGGLCLAVGSRLAGGCTSGHGISGVALLSVSSLVTVACMFAGGMGLAAVLG